MTDSSPRSRPSRRFAIFVLSLALVGGASMADYHLQFFIPRMLTVRAANGWGNGYSFGDDFYPVWLGTRTWSRHHEDLYRPEMTRQIQIGLFGRALDTTNLNDPPADYRQFAYPAFTELLLWPVGLVDFAKLRLLLAVLLPLLTAVSVRFWLLALDWEIDPLWLASIVVLVLCTYELLEAFFAEQPGLIVGFFLAGAALALRRRRLLLAGVLMSLTLIKPQVTLLAIGYLLLWSFADRRRARFWMGFFGVSLCLVAASVWISPHWIGQWIATLRGYHRYAMPPLISVLLGRQLNTRVGRLLVGTVLVLSGAFAWRNRREGVESPLFWWGLSLLLAVTSVAVLPGQAIYDHLILIPGILLLVQYREKFLGGGFVNRGLWIVGALVLLWPWVSAFVLLCMRPFAPAQFGADAVFVLPIRTAASLPFAVLALLAYGLKSGLRLEDLKH
jgi:hypothetical protein